MNLKRKCVKYYDGIIIIFLKADCKELDANKDNLDDVSQYYEGLIYFPINHLDKNEEYFIPNEQWEMNSMFDEKNYTPYNIGNKIEKKSRGKY